MCRPGKLPTAARVSAAGISALSNAAELTLRGTRWGCAARGAVRATRPRAQINASVPPAHCGAPANANEPGARKTGRVFCARCAARRSDTAIASTSESDFRRGDGARGSGKGTPHATSSSESSTQPGKRICNSSRCAICARSGVGPRRRSRCSSACNRASCGSVSGSGYFVSSGGATSRFAARSQSSGVGAVPE